MPELRDMKSPTSSVAAMQENSSVSEHILRMSGYHHHLTQLGDNLPVDSVIDRSSSITATKLQELHDEL